MVVSGNNLKNINDRINEIENEFENLINFKKLNQLLKIINIKYDVDNKETYISNPEPNLNYEDFNNLYFFPDHAVFLPFRFCKENNLNKKDKNIIFFNKEKIYIKQRLNETQLVYLKVLFSICLYINSKKIYNIIDKNIGDNLRLSDDEILRLRVNK
tara:strand:- start:59 stop:529 length:471 start_codon:yes stop_codon:yes gene_type:complete